MNDSSSLWQYRLWSFLGRDTKLESFLAKNHLESMKSMNFENWSSDEVSKSGPHIRKLSDLKIHVIKNIYSSMKKKS